MAYSVVMMMMMNFPTRVRLRVYALEHLLTAEGVNKAQKPSERAEAFGKQHTLSECRQIIAEGNAGSRNVVKPCFPLVKKVWQQ